LRNTKTTARFDLLAEVEPRRKRILLNVRESNLASCRDNRRNHMNRATNDHQGRGGSETGGSTFPMANPAKGLLKVIVSARKSGVIIAREQVWGITVCDFEEMRHSRR
jgi:hypothetical protein